MEAALTNPPKPAGKEHAGTMGGGHDYGVKVMYGALIESASCDVGGFSGFERLTLVKDKAEIRQRAAPLSQFSSRC